MGSAKEPQLQKCLQQSWRDRLIALCTMGNRPEMLQPNKVAELIFHAI